MEQIGLIVTVNILELKMVSSREVASLTLFTVYLDELLVRLEKSNVACYIDHEWYGGFGYADDMELQCPSIRGLQRLVSTCT